MNKHKAYTLLCGDVELSADILPLAPFDSRVTAFLSDLSSALLKAPQAKAYPDVITFAFFCRRANLTQLHQRYAGALASRLGRGLVFHIAPGNVPINFAYSLIAALLAGNASIVKASSQDFPQTQIVCSAMETLLCEAHKALKPYVNVITYPRENQALTQSLSASCDVRIIWGGDETVRRVREAPLPPLAFDVTFADRYSLLCIQPKAVLESSEESLRAMAQGFYNDTFLSDQNACTAPRLVYWVGDEMEIRVAQSRFWQAVHAWTAPRYSLPPVVAVDKLTGLYTAAITLSGAQRVPMADNLITRIRVDALEEGLLDFRCGGGCFVEYESPSLDGLKALSSRKIQTLSYLGLEAESLWRIVREAGLRGIDRIVPLGQTMDFSLFWDGYDLIRTLSRHVQML